MPKAGTPVRDEHHVARYCKPSSIGPDGLPQAAAFLLRPTEDHLSTNWLEYFGAATRDDAIRCVQAVLAHQGFRLRPNGRFGVLNVGSAKKSTSELGVEILHRPVSNDQSHVGIYVPRENLLEVALELSDGLRNDCIFPAC